MAYGENPADATPNGNLPFLFDDVDWAEMLAFGGPLTTPIFLTFFENVHASRVTLEKMSLIDLAKRIEGQTAHDKPDLPLLSLGRYGKTRTAKGSLRHKANLKRVFGVEGDYDAGDMAPEDAAELLRQNNIGALIYTTPSHGQPQKGNRWRVILPLETPCKPEDRGKYLARVDVVLGQVLSKESYRLSQAFYFGGVENGLPIKSFLVDGDYIDERCDLDDGAIDLSPVIHETPPVPAIDQSGIKEAVAAAKEALASAIKKVSTAEMGMRTDMLYKQAYRLGGLVACATLDADEVKEALFEAAQHNGYSADYKDADIVRHVRNGLTDGAERPTPWSDKSAVVFDEIDEEVDDQRSSAGLSFHAPDAWAKRPPRDYIVKGLIGPEQHGCIFGEPGAGKSVIAPKLAYMVAQGKLFYGIKTKPGPVLYIPCEDEDGMGARFEALRQEHGDAPNLQLVCGCHDLFSSGVVANQGSPQLEELRRKVKQEKTILIVIDTLAMSAPGLDENSAEGMGRINAISSTLAKYGAAVIWVHHGTKAEGNTPRGHSSFNGRLDFSLLVRKADQAGIVRGVLQKNRLGSTDQQFAYRIEKHVVKKDIDGDPVTAPFCRECTGADAAPVRHMSPTNRLALNILHQEVDENGRVDKDAFRAVLKQHPGMCGSDKPEAKRQAASRAIKFLATLHEVTVEENVIYLKRDEASTYEFDDLDEDDDETDGDIE
ncbi:MAG: AAA family ATPase [Pseudomonadota bacterium]